MTWLWWIFGIALTFAIFETKGIYDGIPDTTLSAKFWALRRSLWFRLLIGGGLGWALHHLLNPWDDETGGWDDLIAITIGAGLIGASQYKHRTGT